MKKRILSIVLAVLMLVSVLPISALAADVEPPIAETGVSTKTSENTTGPKLEKSAQWVDEKAGIAKITIKVTGEQPTQSTKKTDIVLVIDRSLSMTQYGRDWLDNAKKAAKVFAKKVLTGDPNVRIAVVAYAAKTIDNRDFSSKLATVENNIDAINTNNVYYDGHWYADHDSLWSENWHGTNIQAGIHSARERFKSTGNNDANKFMIVLADGAPNYRFTYKDWGIGTKFDLTDAQKRTYHINNWFSWLFYATSDAFNYNEVKNTEQYAYTAAASEAYAAKATDGITCYAIGYGIPQGNNEINALMYSIASTDAGFVNAGTDENAITKVFSDIATDIQYKAHDVTLTDTMGAGFTYLSNETYPSSPEVTPSADNKTVTWNVADKLGDETKTLTFYVQYDKQNLTDAATLLTNTSASLSYKDNKGNAQPNITVASPEIENLAFTVTYLDETGKELTDAPYTKTRYWHGDTVTLAPAPTKEGYTFNGWTTDDVDIGENETSFEMPKQNVTLKASWIKNEPTTKTITVTKVWDKDVTDAQKQPVVITLYQKVGMGTVNPETDYYDSITLNGTETAPWTGVFKDLPLKNDKDEKYGYAVVETRIGTLQVTNGSANVIRMNEDGESAYTVGTWFVNSSMTPAEPNTYYITNTYTSKPQYTLDYQFVGNAPTGVDEPVGRSDCYEGEKITLTAMQKVTGWKFDGWYSDDTCTTKVNDPYRMPAGNVTLYGKWEQKQPGVSVEKTAKRIRNGIEEDLPSGTGTVRVDDTIKYTVKATNTGNVELRNVSILECFGGRNKFEDDKTKQKVSGLFDRYGFTIAQTLAPGATATRTFTYVVTDADEDYGVIKNHLSMQEATYFDGQKDAKIPPKTAPSHEVKVEKPKYKLSYEFKSGDDTITTLPENVLSQNNPAYSDEVEVGTDVTLPSGFTEVTDTVNKGKWTFVGWYTDDNLSAESKITGDTYPMPEGGKTLYGKWTFTKDKPEDTTLTIAYYLMHADGTYPSEATDSATTDGKVGEDFTAEPMKTAYDDKGYKFDDSADNRIRGDLVLDPNGNVFKLYYKAVPGLTVAKTITDVTRDGEPLDPTDPEVEVKEGDVIEYEITVRNSGKLNLTNVVLTDEFTGAEGDLNIISGDEYTVNGYEITLENDLNVGDSVTIKATYEVQLGDSGYEITNKASGTAKDALGGDVTGESERVTIRPDALKAYRIFGSVYKYVKSEKGTFNKDGEIVPFEFKVTSDKKGEEILDTFTIDVEETVKAGETSEGDWGGFDFNLSEEEFENLDKKEFNGKEYPVVYLWELKGDLKNMSYSTKRITLYLDRPNISYYSAREPMVEYLGTRMAYADPDKGADADIINIYGKQSSSGGTVKVGPQLNRDDHVAYIMGYPDGRVRPEGEITRAEACTIFFRLLTDSSRDYYFSKTNDYTDVNAGDWFNNAISTLSNAGIVTGYNDGTFRPNQPITRGEMAKIIANFANLNKGTKSFTDLSGHWSKTYVELAAGNGWIAGYPDGSFRPDQKITRAETVTMINRVLERVPAKELRLLSRSIMLTFPDNNPGDWYYIAIQEASNSHEYQRSVYETTGDEMWTKLIDNVDWTKLEK